MSDKRVTNIIGVLAILSLIVIVYELIKSKTDTKLYSDDAYNELQDKDKLEALSDAVVEYQKNGTWKDSVLE